MKILYADGKNYICPHCGCLSQGLVVRGDKPKEHYCPVCPKCKNNLKEAKSNGS